MIQLMIDNGKQKFRPVVTGPVTWSLERRGVPGKLEFTLLQDDILEFSEGSMVILYADGRLVFSGFVFARGHGKDRLVKVTAYDQLRYLKNKDSYKYENKTATEVIRLLAADFNLQTGELEDTGFPIVARSEPDKSLFDIILNALDLTMISTGKMYIFYDDCGKLTLKSLENMKYPLWILDKTAEDYDYSSSIDGDTYNQVKVSIDNEESGKKEVYVKKNPENIIAWGVLQYYHKADKEGTGGDAMADSLLRKYNQKTKNLSIKGALGDVSVRAGSLIPVTLDMEDDSLSVYMLVEKVTHSFDGSDHRMDLTMRGGGFSV